MIRILLICGLTLSFAFLALAQDDTLKKGKVKAQTQFAAAVEKAIDVASSSVGEDVNFKIAQDIRGEGMVIAKGSVVLGRIVSVEPISGKNKSSKISIMFDFIQSGEDFMSCMAVIVSIDQITDDVKFSRSKAYAGSTVLSLAGKNLRIDAGKVFRIKLLKDLSTN